MSGNEKQPLVPRLRFPEFRDAGEWITVELGKLSRLLTERVGSTTCTPYTITSGVGLISQEEKLGRTIAGNSLKNYLVLQENDFAYNKSATKAYPQGFIALYAGDERAAVPNSIFTCFRVNQNHVIPTFLDALFTSNLHGKWLRTRIAVGARAHGSLQVSDDDLMATPVPLPNGISSLKEQQKIADCLSSLDDLISAEARKLDTLKTHKKGLMQQLFPREGETVPRLRFPEFEATEEWQENQLGNLVEIRSGHSPSQYQLGGDGSYPFIKVEDLNNCTKYQVEAREYSSDAYGLIPCDSVIFPKRGAAIALNKIRLTRDELLMDTNMMALTPQAQCSAEFLFYYLSNIGLSQIADDSTIPQINNKHIIPFRIATPSIDEQYRISDCLSALDESITNQALKLESIKTHKKSLMQQLFPVLDEAQA